MVPYDSARRVYTIPLQTRLKLVQFCAESKILEIEEIDQAQRVP